MNKMIATVIANLRRNIKIPPKVLGGADEGYISKLKRNKETASLLNASGNRGMRTAAIAESVREVVEVCIE